MTPATHILGVTTDELAGRKSEQQRVLSRGLVSLFSHTPFVDLVKHHFPPVFQKRGRGEKMDCPANNTA